MRQTPFGVWNIEEDAEGRPLRYSFNEADAFRRLECKGLLSRVLDKLEASMRQTPFGVWNAEGRGRAGAAGMLQ